MFGHAVDATELERVLGQFFQEQHATAEVPARGSIILAVDGQTLRGTIPTGHTRGVHLVAAYLPRKGVVLAQVAVDRKENEIVAVPTLLRQLDLTGMVVGAQRALSSQVVEAGGDYLWLVKENQPAPTTDFTTARRVDKRHGRLEERTVTERGKRTVEVCYGITSCPKTVTLEASLHKTYARRFVAATTPG